jgi:hypothetical protein
MEHAKGNVMRHEKKGDGDDSRQGISPQAEIAKHDM